MYMYKVRNVKIIKLLLNFIDSKQVDASSYIIFLGDIFDLMVGKQVEYYSLYQDFFDSIKYLVRKKKKVIFIEGNHDFHLGNLFKDKYPDLKVEVINQVEFKHNFSSLPSYSFEKDSLGGSGIIV